MKRVKRLGLFLGLSIVLLATTTFAQSATWDFKLPIYITDTSGATRTYTPVIIPSGMDKLSAYTVTGLDTNMQSGGADVKYLITDNKTLTVVPTLPANGRITHDLYTGYSPAQTTFPVITGNGGSVNITDSANLEWSSNGSATLTNYYVNTANVTNILVKPSAITFTSGSSNVTISLYDSVGAVLNSVSRATTTGNHTLSASLDGTGMYVSVDGVTSTTNISAQDLLYYTESDATNKITETATTVTGVNVLANADTFLSKNFGATHFDALDVRFEIYTENQGVNPLGQCGTAFAGVNNDISGFGATDLSITSNSQGGNVVHITLMRGNGVATDAYIGGASATSYYVRVTRPAAGDTVTVRIYSDAAMTTLLDTLTVAGFGVAQWQYAYGFVNYNVGLANRQWDGFIRNFDIQGRVIDNATTWNGLQNAAYVDNVTMSVGGTRQLLFAPNATISGTTLPDRDATGGSQNGFIIWGSNSGIALTYGAIVYNGNTSASGSISEGYVAEDMPMPSRWFGAYGLTPAQADASFAGVLFYETIHQQYVDGGFPTLTVYTWIFIGLALLLFLLVAVKSKSIAAALGAAIIVLFFGSQVGTAGAIPLWLPTIGLIMETALVFTYRQVA